MSKLRAPSPKYFTLGLNYSTRIAGAPSYEHSQKDIKPVIHDNSKAIQKGLGALRYGSGIKAHTGSNLSLDKSRKRSSKQVESDINYPKIL